MLRSPSDWVERLSGDEGDWPMGSLRLADVPWSHRVSELVPAGYEAYLRLFHPFLPRGTGRNVPTADGVRRTWRELAAEAGVTYHPELTWVGLRAGFGPDSGAPRHEVWDGDLEPAMRTALYEHLAASTRSQVCFRFGLGAVIASRSDTGAALYRAPATALEEVRQRAREDLHVTTVPGPEHAWAEDRSWVLCSDIDLSSSYLACSAGLATAVLDDPRLEALPVTQETRVDDGADLLNGAGWADT